MKTVQVSELEANLSAHLKLVSGGEEVLVCDQDRPIARIVPLDTSEYSERTQRLIAKGVLRPPQRKPGEPRYIPPAPTNRPISQEVMDALWEEERADRV